MVSSHDLFICPRDHYCENSKKYLRIMAKVNADIEDLHESSLDSSADGEYMGLMKEENFGSPVTYKLIPMAGDETTTNMQHSPLHQNDGTFYVISNPEVFTTHTHSTVALTVGSNKKTFKREAGQSKAVNTAKKRDDKRRATHNEVERRRRDKINTWIMKLAALVPNSGMPDTASKGGILAKACDHITDLTEKQKRLEKLEVDNEKLVLEVLRLNQELSEVRKENASMRNQMADNCIVYPRNKGQKS